MTSHVVPKLQVIYFYKLKSTVLSLSSLVYLLFIIEENENNMA